MNTKEAIKLLKNSWLGIGDKIIINISEGNANDIISLLQRGEKYEKIFKEIENIYGSDLTWDIEQKYFPEEAKDEY